MNQDIEPFPVPYWVEPFAPLIRYYSNPIFQKNLLRNTIVINFDLTWSFYIGMFFFLVLAANPGAWPLIIGVELFALFKIFPYAVPSTIEGLKNILNRDRHDPLLSAPIPDGAIYFGVVFGRLMRGSEMLGHLFAFFGGLLVLPGAALVIMIILSPFFLSIARYFGESAHGFGMLLLLIVSMLSVFPALNFSAGLYGLVLDRQSAIAAAVFHTLFVLVAPVLLGILILYLLDSEVMRGGMISAAITVPAVVVQLFSIYLSARMGLSLFSRLRRQGIYCE